MLIIHFRDEIKKSRAKNRWQKRYSYQAIFNRKIKKRLQEQEMQKFKINVIEDAAKKDGTSTKNSEEMNSPSFAEALQEHNQHNFIVNKLLIALIV